MGSVQTLVCVKRVKQESAEEWNESMPLPGDVIESIAAKEGDEFFVPAAKVRSEVSSQLGKLNKNVDIIWVKIRRGDSTVKLQACVVQDRTSKLQQRRFTIRAFSDDRHVAVLGDLTLERCYELQELSRKVVNFEERGFKKKEVRYNWTKVVGAYLPDRSSTVVSSILFIPLPGERGVGATTARCMAWFSAAVSSGVPLIFVNIQTEQIITSEKTSAGEICWARQQSCNTTIETAQGIRLWFLPGVAEIPIVLKPRNGEIRLGMDIKRTEEGFICINTVAKDSASYRAGLGHLHEQARELDQLLVLSRLEGKSLLPSMVSSTGLIHCCDSVDVKEFLASALDKMDWIHLHVMTWPNCKLVCSSSSSSPTNDASSKINIYNIDTIMPPPQGPSCPPMSSFSQTNLKRLLD